MPYINKGLSTKICSITKYVTGSPITINNQFGDRLVDLKALVTAMQSGSGDPSPSNVRPISGWNSVDLSVNGIVTTISLDNTYYGGVLDVTTGVLNVTHGTFDMGDMSWNFDSFSRFTSNTIKDLIKHSGSGWSNAFWCEIFTPSLNVLQNNYLISMFNSTGVIYVRDDDYTTVSDFVEAVKGNKLLFELANSFNIQLTPTQIELIAGNNTISADSGNIEAIFKTFTP